MTKRMKMLTKRLAALSLAVCCAFALVQTFGTGVGVSAYADNGDNYYSAIGIRLNQKVTTDSGRETAKYYKFKTGSHKDSTYRMSLMLTGTNDPSWHYGYVEATIVDSAFKEVNGVNVYRGISVTSQAPGKTGDYLLSPNTTYYVCVKGGYLDEGAISTTLLTIKERITRPTKLVIMKNEALKGGLKVSFSASSVAKYYEVRYHSVGAAKWKKATTKKTSIKLTGLKRGKRYLVQVRGVRVVSGKKYYGQWSYHSVSNRAVK